jgi:hypothetical protein
MDLGGGVDAWEILANGGNRGQPGSCALKALPYVQAGTLGRALLVTGGVDVAPGVATVARRNNCGCRDDQFVVAHERRGFG